MSDEKRKRVRSVFLGCPPKRLKHEIHTMEFRFNDFASQNQVRGKHVETPSIRAHGYDWFLHVHPRGSPSSVEDIEYVSCFLLCAGGKSVAPSAKFTIRCKDRMIRPSQLRVFDRHWGKLNFLERTDVLENYLDEDGSLVIEVDIQIAVEKSNVWYPDPLQKEPSLVKLYRTSESTSDITFVVDGKEFHAHKNILSLRAETLFELTKENDDDEGKIFIDMEGCIFEQILEYVYTVKTPEIKNEGIAIKLFLAADRFGCTELKLFIESTIVDKFLNATNAAKWLLLSDAHTCALLKEASMRLHESDACTVMESKDDWSRVVESNRLLEELFKFVTYKSYVDLPNSRNRNRNSSSNTVVDGENLDVTTLREKLLEAELEIDGSRNILIERLKNYQQEKSVLTE